MSEFMHILCFPENERITPILLWDGCYWFTEYGRRWGRVWGVLGGRWKGVGRALGGCGGCGGCWEGVGRALASGEGWARPGSLIYRQITELR